MTSQSSSGGNRRSSRTSGEKRQQPRSPSEAAAAASSDSSPASPAPSSPKVAGAGSLGLVGGRFTPAGPNDESRAPSAATARDLEAERGYEPPPPAPIEWDEERMGLVLRGVGFALHELDPIADSDYAGELWKMTDDDLEAISGPASRIANRYDVTRYAAGKSDEIGLGVAVWPYFKRNLATRGRARALERARLEADNAEHRPLYGAPPPPPPPAPAPEPARESDQWSEPAVVEATEPEQPGSDTRDPLDAFGP